MKPAERFDGVVNERVLFPTEKYATLDATVVGPDPTDEHDTVTLMSGALGISVSLRLPRDVARRLGELLILAADDVTDAPVVTS